jgi:hypothetical protein
MQRKQLLQLMIIPTSGPQNITRIYSRNITQAAARAAAAPPTHAGLRRTQAAGQRKEEVDKRPSHPPQLQTISC